MISVRVVLQDLRHALRGLRHSPGYATTCILVLALGIGCNAAIFSVVHAVVLRPLPYPDLDRLVMVWQRFPAMPAPFGPRFFVTRKKLLAWKQQNGVFAEMAAFCDRTQTETGAGYPRQVHTGFASADLFPMLGARARLGRVFSAGEERPGSDRVAVLSDPYFDRRFQRNPRALGATVTLDGAPHVVIGVLPRGFHLPSTMEGQDQLKPDLWVPLSRFGRAEDNAPELLVAARLRPGVSLAAARTEMAAIAERLAQAEEGENKGFSASVFPFSVEDAEPKLHRAVIVLFAAVGFLLLIACANLANLTLARATQRSREIAVRLALGATRSRIVGHLLTESLVVSLVGAACGLALAGGAIKLMLRAEPPDLQRPELIDLNLSVFLFAAAAAVLTTVLFGLAPAIAVSGTDLNIALKTGGGGASAARLRSRQLLITIEVALALVLMSGAGLMIRSFRELIETGIGFDTRHMITADVELPEKRYPDAARQARFFRDLTERVRALSGVRAAAITDNLPLHQVSFSNFYIAGRPEPPVTALPMADKAKVSPDYFAALGLPLRAGRLFLESDLARTQKNAVAIVNEAFASKFFPAENPLGQRLLESDRQQSSEIVGVVADYRPMGAENGARPQIFRPTLAVRTATVVARTSAAPASYSAALRATVADLDKDLALDKVETMDHYVGQWQASRKYYTLLLTFFSALALVLAMVGIFGVLSSLVAARRREIGIRMAIGASPADIGELVLRQGLAPVGIGLVLGLAGSLMLSRFLEALLFQVHPRDPATLGIAALSILLVSPLALYSPLRRAIRVDCTVALREE
jgi:putative ABC transport system permease protein